VTKKSQDLVNFKVLPKCLRSVHIETLIKKLISTIDKIMNNINGTFHCNYFLSNQIFGECSGKGACVNEWNKLTKQFGVCDCQEGWTGNGDMVNAEGMDCNIYIPLVTTWWLVIAILFAFHSLYMLKVCYPIAKEKGWKKGVWGNSQLRVLSVGAILAPIRVWEGLYRFSTKSFVGHDLFMTLMHMLYGYMFWGYMAPTILSEWLKLVILQSKMGGAEGKKMAEMMKNNERRSHRMKFIAFFAYAGILISYFVDDINLMIFLQCFYYGAHTILSYFLVNTVALPAGYKIIETFEESISKTPNEKISASLMKLKVFVREARNNGATNLLLCILFTALPYLFNMASYQLMIGWTSAVIIITICAWLLSSPMKKKKGEGGGTGKSTKVSPTETAVSANSEGSDV